MHFNWQFFSYHMQNLEYNNKNFPKIPQDSMHTKPRLQALNNFNFGSKDQRYKKEGPDLYKVSTQLQIEILNKRSRADFTVGNIHVYFLLPIFRKARPPFIRVLQTMIRLC